MGTDETNRSFAAMDNTRTQDPIPQLSQEKILKIMNMVKNKELSIEGALDLAQKETYAEKEAMNMAFLMDSQDLLTGSQFNFSVYKYKRYRWQKRILQIDFNTETIFNIEKGIIKKQFPFSQVKSYEDSEGRRFSITFHGRGDYELEAMSLEDKTKISHLVNKVTQSNSYRRAAESCSGRPAKGDVIHEGLLDLQQDSFASIKWVKYLVQLSEGELSLSCIGNNGENKNADPVAKTINLSDGNVRVIKENGYDTFSVQTKEHNYLFQIPLTVQNNRAEDISKLQNEWVSLIDRYCMLWKKCSEPQHGFGEGTSEAVYEKLIISPNKRAEGAHCLAVGSEAPPQSTPFTEQTTPGSSFLLSRVQAVVPPPPSFPLPSRPSPAWKRTKAFHWDVVPQDKIQKSIWASCSQHKKKIDEFRIYNQFQIQDMAIFSGNEPSVNRHIMLNQKIAHTFNIFLKSFHIKPNQLKEKLYMLHEDSGGLTDEQITALRRYLPTPKDLEMYQSFKGSPSELHVVDQFMLEMCKIPHLGQRLDLLLTIRELPVCMGDLEPLINQKIRACKELQASQKFVAVLEYILAIGNYLNEKAGREMAKGFQLSSLTKLSLLRGKERKITLLHALVEQIFLHEPDLAKFSQELTEFEAVPGASIKGLSAEIDVLKKELENVIQYRKFIKSKTIKATTQESQFYKELKDLIQKYEGHLSQLSKRCDEMKKLYTDTLVKFGESPDQDSQELFGWISAFIREFRKVSADIM
ncbi:disheveled-associated activator of morphogenesis 2-like isoform X2 [Chelonoidis abingdonii]|uniref:disheveled-associated activator of morphogenesis 2-like isoform X2 n=1 Tax=Chelonoidis abingdonii TaxID=106734 RepID=UPI0013F2AF72|nr:formin-I-like isoform X2 [Chelonoidis abingdonii]